MLVNLNRETFIQLLEKLRSDDDDEILTAARDINAQMTVAELNWDDLLMPEGGPPEAAELEKAEEDEYEDEDESDMDTESLPESAEIDDGLSDPLREEDEAEALSIIENILALEISDTTREEMEDYKQDITEGEFEQMDLRYLRALHTRLKQ